MSNYSLPLFMQVKENAVQDLNKNLSLYMPKLINDRRTFTDFREKSRCSIETVTGF